MPVGHLHFLFGKMSVLFFSPFFSLVVCFVLFCLLLSCMISLYMLDINPLSVISFANIFSHLFCLFILLMVSFIVQKLLALTRSHLFIFAFMSFTLGEESKKYYCDLCQRVFWLCFPLGVLQYLVLLIRSLIHFEFIFVYGVRECSNLIILRVAVQFSQHHLFKRLSFLYCIFLPPLSQIN